MGKTVYAIATMDTKGEEIAYVAQCARNAGADVVVVDVGTQTGPQGAPDVSREEIAACHVGGSGVVLGHTDRGQAVTAMGEALCAYMLQAYGEGKVDGMIGIGGSGGTALVSPAMQALPIGVPKVLVSTVASGNTEPYVGCCDITMMYSVVDVAGINRVSREVLGNAGHAIAGMVTNQVGEAEEKPTIGMTMFGVTTPCVTAVRESMEAEGYDCLVFHATGTGGQAMEKLVESGMIDGVLDITTTEVADEVVGGVFPAGPERFDRILEKGIPYVVSLGALDMVNFGAEDTVPEQFRGRTLYVHNAQVTLMRTTVEENRQFAAWIAGKLNRSTSPVRILIPEKGVSLIDVEGQPFYDAEADRALFEALEEAIDQTGDRQIVRYPLDINDPAFSEALLAQFQEVAKGRITKPGGDGRGVE
ncbi:MAG: Tm-1-like ATP-binding domain-containing protein [bacterium]|nr:Tm-1-like ATP-binding domain-containing protein [bacterium]